MKNSSKLIRTILNSNSSTESNSDDDDDDRCRLSTSDHIEQLILRDRRSFHGSNSSTTQISDELLLEKTGWAHVKHWLTVRSNQLVDISSKTSWKRYWIWLKDCNLQLFNNYLDSHSHLTINLIDCLCYPFHEHRHDVFTLTTYTGDIFYFQCSDFNEWIHSIHRNCLSKLTKTRLKSNLKQLETDLIYETKVLKLAELQLKLTTNNQTRSIISKQIQLLKENLEQFHINIFRKRSYLLSLNTNQSLLNSTDLLSQLSSSTKTILCNLHAMTPGAVYACVLSRKRLKSQSLSTDSLEISPNVLQTVIFDSSPQRKIIIPITKTTTVGELLQRVTEKFNFPTNEYFLYFHTNSSAGFQAKSHEKLHHLTYSSIEIRRKIVYEIQLNHQLNLSGIEIDRHYLSTILISYVNKGSEGERLGVRQDDEIVMINHCNLKDLDLTVINRYLNQTPIILTLRSSRLNISSTKNQKIISELIQTEKSYIQDLQSLSKQYIEPLLKDSTILSSDIIEPFSDNIKSIEQLQNLVFQNLQSSLSAENPLITICDIFINYSHEFKIYSTYCSFHVRLTRLLQTNEQFKEFVDKCNPSQQHSSSFQSYLIKPVQRVLKYSLFLEQLLDFPEKIQSKETFRTQKAVKMMNKISRYINSMQELAEEFGQTFEYFRRNSNESFDFNLSNLCAYGEIQWINIYRFLSKKNSANLKSFMFVFRTGCFLLVRDEFSKKNQDSRNLSDCFVRFMPMNDLEVELINSNNQIWQLTQTNSNAKIKTYFRFANKDADIFVKTINNCLVDNVSKSRSCYDLLPNENFIDQYSEEIYSTMYRRNPSPIWKRRTKSSRRRPLSMPTNRN